MPRCRKFPTVSPISSSRDGRATRILTSSTGGSAKSSTVIIIGSRVRIVIRSSKKPQIANTIIASESLRGVRRDSRTTMAAGDSQLTTNNDFFFCEKKNCS
uniref:(northern house mosquito) hypothetical protein n=1 Tax=Culex pipiens TaxID=7175 RepID=A0A8D8C0S7_CULPI